MNTRSRRPDYQRAMCEASALLEQFGYNDPPVNPMKIANGLGIKVEFVTFAEKNQNVSGFYDPSENKIYVNAAEFPKRQTFTIAHELGHARLHRQWAESENYRVLMRDMEAGSADPKEKEANVFAAHLLVPRYMLEKYWNKMTVPDLSDMFVVSNSMIGHRISREYDDSRRSV